MKLNYASTAFLLILVIPAAAQEQPSQQEQLRCAAPADLYLSSGAFTESPIYGTLQEFKTLAPQSVLLGQDLTGFKTSMGWMMNSSSSTSIALGLKFRNKDQSSYRANPQLRVGLVYDRANPLSLYYYKNETKPYDTLSSSQSGTAYYVDSIKRTSYSMSYGYQQLRLDIALLFRTDPARRWSLYAGAALAGGGSFNTYTYITKVVTEGIVTHDASGGTFTESTTDFDLSFERFRNRSNFSFWASVPLGIDFRLGKKRELLKRIHLYYEMRPGVNITFIPELRSYTTVSIHQALGIRVSLGK
jgi:hypothetical protein